MLPPEVKDHIHALVTKAPPLSREQRAKLAHLLKDTVRKRDSRVAVAA